MFYSYIQRAEISISFSTTGDSNALVEHQHFQGDRKKKIEDAAEVAKRAIFQTFWKLHCCAKSLFLELETSNCGYLLIF